MKKAVFFDIDGTLINSHNGKQDISDRVKMALRNVQRKGHYIFIAMGRPYAFLNETIREFGFDGYILANGAHVRINRKNIHYKPLDKSFLKALATILDKRGIEYVLEDELNAYAFGHYEKMWPFYQNYGIFKEQFVLDYNLEQTNTFKVEVLCETQEDLNDCIEFLKNHEAYTYCHSLHPMRLEIYLKERDKAAGILEALSYLNIPIEQTYAFGDGTNDIEMLETIGCGIAMGNASDEVKKYANVITGTITNDWVSIGIEKYILNG